jgi:hypothetical protein
MPGVKLAGVVLVSLACCCLSAKRSISQTAIRDFPLGDRTFVDTDILVLRPDGSMAANQELYTAEAIGGGTSIISSLLHTDEKGHLYLHGYYCLPMQVFVKDKIISMNSDTIRLKYTMQMKERWYTLREIFGDPDENIMRNIEKIRVNCDL